jgi:hypothetical protein
MFPEMLQSTVNIVAGAIALYLMHPPEAATAKEGKEESDTPQPTSSSLNEK